MGFTEYLEKPELAERYQKVRKYFYLRESAYDVTSACQLRCDGCFYFEGDKYKTRDNRDPEVWRQFLQHEKERGVNYVNLAGAEPALAPAVLKVCYDVIPLGNIFSNGLRKIDPALRYRIHLSVWGDHTGDPVYRKYAGGRIGSWTLPKQLDNYRGDERPIFVYTFNNENIDQLDEVLLRVRDEGHQVTFNVFSAPEHNESQLKLRDTLQRTREKMQASIEEYPETVVYSHYNAEVHTQEQSLHQQFGCPYPRAQIMEGRDGVGIGKTFRSYRTDLTHVPASDCCVPDTDCADCRHYAAGSAIVTSRLTMHVESEKQFRGWLDYVDTYLAVWILGYTKGENLYAH